MLDKKKRRNQLHKNCEIPLMIMSLQFFFTTHVAKIFISTRKNFKQQWFLHLFQQLQFQTQIKMIVFYFI